MRGVDIHVRAIILGKPDVKFLKDFISDVEIKDMF
jgi:hypothetical protein